MAAIRRAQILAVCGKNGYKWHLFMSLSLFFFFFWLHLSCSTQDHHCIVQELLVQCIDYTVVANRLHCAAACGTSVPQPGIKPTSALQGRFLTTGPPKKCLSLPFKDEIQNYFLQYQGLFTSCYVITSNFQV